VASGLSRCKCYASDEASHLLNKIDTPVFQTNTLNVEFPQQTTMVQGGLYELQDLDPTSLQGAWGMDEL